MKKAKILIAEDDDLSRKNLAELLSEYGYDVQAVRNGKEAMETFPCDKYDLVITDLKMPHVDGLQFLEFVKEVNPENIVIVVTGYASVESAVEAMKLGAFDYMMKPLKDDIVQLTVQRALSFARLKHENITLKDHLKKKINFGKIIGYSDGMKKVFEIIEKVASSDSTIIIYGESGTGKELVARAIHFNSDRAAKPLVTVNCGAIPEELLESELFGHEKGAFTGAIRGRIGRFELAQEGSIFLDEIGDMSPSLQVKLLLLSSYVDRGLNDLMEMGLFRYMIPELYLQKDYDQNSKYHACDLWRHTVRVTSSAPPDINLRWAALLHDIAKPFVRIEKEDRSTYANHDILGREMVIRLGAFDYMMKSGMKSYGITVYKSTKTVSRTLNKFIA